MERNQYLLGQFKNDSISLENEKIGKVIKSVIMSKLLYMTKENKFISYEAEEYIRDLSEFSKYCKDGKQEEWKELVRNTVYSSGEGNDERVLFELESFERAGAIMKMQDEGASFEDIHKYFFENACETPTDQILFGLKMLSFAKDGRKFILEHYGDNLPHKRILLEMQSIDIDR